MEVRGWEEVARNPPSRERLHERLHEPKKAKGFTVRVTVKPLFYWSHLGESNSRPIDYESIALPSELRWRGVVHCGFLL